MSKFKNMLTKQPNELTTGESLVYGVVFTAGVCAAYAAAWGVGYAGYVVYTAVKDAVKKRKEKKVKEHEMTEWCYDPDEEEALE